jgi:hypothetical protein
MAAFGVRRVLDDQGHAMLLAESLPSDSEDTTPLPPPSSRPANVDVGEWHRRHDAVREAAREFETLTSQDIRERLKGLTSRELTDGDVTQFESDVRAQQLHDLIDALDQAHRGKKRGRRTVRIQMPRGYVRYAVHRLTQDELVDAGTRLAARGWTPMEVKEKVYSKLSKKQLDGLTLPE